MRNDTPHSPSGRAIALSGPGCDHYNRRMLEPALQILRERYGYSSFRGLQAEVITAVLEGHDSVVLMPTGSGKSLCYQIPSLLRDGIGLVVSPLIALMQDQVAALRQLGIRAAFLNSSLSLPAQREVMQAVSSAALDILYVAPERLLREETLSWLAAQRIALIAIDEAHCVSQWGHDFREDYLALGSIRAHFPGVPRMALTATADRRTREEIATRLDLATPRWFVSSFDRPNIRYTVTEKKDARAQLLKFLALHRNEAGIVYCMSRDKTERTAEWLNSQGYRALPYHAGLPGEQRTRNQARFLAEDALIMCATIAFGMGIDKPDVRFVVHLDLPKSMEAYYQETGRAGRDGAHADAWMIYGLQDVVRLRQMLDQSTAEEQHKRHERQKLDGLLGWCEITACRRQALLAYFGDDYPQTCGNCDVCLRPPATWDATIAAQQLLSCVYRTGQRFGAVHLIEVLLGNPSPKISQHGHERLSVFGIGRALSVAQWRSVIRQLLVRGLLRVDVEQFSALVLTEASRPLLRGEIILELREDSAEPVSRKRTRPEAIPTLAGEEPLWEALRACRKRLATDQGVPPYVIFHDSTLKAIAAQSPRSLAELGAISGVGAAKLARYGEQFLAVINELQDEPPL